MNYRETECMSLTGNDAHEKISTDGKCTLICNVFITWSHPPKILIYSNVQKRSVKIWKTSCTEVIWAMRKREEALYRSCLFLQVREKVVCLTTWRLDSRKYGFYHSPGDSGLCPADRLKRTQHKWSAHQGHAGPPGSQETWSSHTKAGLVETYALCSIFNQCPWFVPGISLNYLMHF